MNSPPGARAGGTGAAESVPAGRALVTVLAGSGLPAGWGVAAGLAMPVELASFATGGVWSSSAGVFAPSGRSAVSAVAALAAGSDESAALRLTVAVELAGVSANLRMPVSRLISLSSTGTSVGSLNDSAALASAASAGFVVTTPIKNGSTTDRVPSNDC